jgi:hypothetical protein
MFLLVLLGSEGSIRFDGKTVKVADDEQPKLNGWKKSV